MCTQQGPRSKIHLQKKKCQTSEDSTILSEDRKTGRESSQRSRGQIVVHNVRTNKCKETPQRVETSGERKDYDINCSRTSTAKRFCCSKSHQKMGLRKRKSKAAESPDDSFEKPLNLYERKPFQLYSTDYFSQSDQQKLQNISLSKLSKELSGITQKLMDYSNKDARNDEICNVKDEEEMTCNLACQPKQFCEQHEQQCEQKQCCNADKSCPVSNSVVRSPDCSPDGEGGNCINSKLSKRGSNTNENQCFNKYTNLDYPSNMCPNYYNKNVFQDPCAKNTGPLDEEIFNKILKETSCSQFQGTLASWNSKPRLKKNCFYSTPQFTCGWPEIESESSSESVTIPRVGKIYRALEMCSDSSEEMFSADTENESFEGERCAKRRAYVLAKIADYARKREEEDEYEDDMPCDSRRRTKTIKRVSFFDENNECGRQSRTLLVKETCIDEQGGCCNEYSVNLCFPETERDQTCKRSNIYDSKPQDTIKKEVNQKTNNCKKANNEIFQEDKTNNDECIKKSNPKSKTCLSKKESCKTSVETSDFACQTNFCECVDECDESIKATSKQGTCQDNKTVNVSTQVSKYSFQKDCDSLTKNCVGCISKERKLLKKEYGQQRLCLEIGVTNKNIQVCLESNVCPLSDPSEELTSEKVYSNCSDTTAEESDMQEIRQNDLEDVPPCLVQNRVREFEEKERKNKETCSTPCARPQLSTDINRCQQMSTEVSKETCSTPCARPQLSTDVNRCQQMSREVNKERSSTSCARSQLSTDVNRCQQMSTEVNKERSSTPCARSQLSTDVNRCQQMSTEVNKETSSAPCPRPQLSTDVNRSEASSSNEDEPSEMALESEQINRRIPNCSCILSKKGHKDVENYDSEKTQKETTFKDSDISDDDCKDAYDKLSSDSQCASSFEDDCCIESCSISDQSLLRNCEPTEFNKTDDMIKPQFSQKTRPSYKYVVDNQTENEEEETNKRVLNLKETVTTLNLIEPEKRAVDKSRLSGVGSMHLVDGPDKCNGEQQSKVKDRHLRDDKNKESRCECLDKYGSTECSSTSLNVVSATSYSLEKTDTEMKRNNCQKQCQKNNDTHSRRQVTSLELRECERKENKCNRVIVGNEQRSRCLARKDKFLDTKCHHGKEDLIKYKKNSCSGTENKSRTKEKMAEVTKACEQLNSDSHRMGCREHVSRKDVVEPCQDRAREDDIKEEEEVGGQRCASVQQPCYSKDPKLDELEENTENRGNNFECSRKPGQCKVIKVVVGDPSSQVEEEGEWILVYQRGGHAFKHQGDWNSTSRCINELSRKPKPKTKQCCPISIYECRKVVCKSRTAPKSAQLPCGSLKARKKCCRQCTTSGIQENDRQCKLDNSKKECNMQSKKPNNKGVCPDYVKCKRNNSSAYKQRCPVVMHEYFAKVEPFNFAQFEDGALGETVLDGMGRPVLLADALKSEARRVREYPKNTGFRSQKGTLDELSRKIPLLEIVESKSVSPMKLELLSPSFQTTQITENNKSESSLPRRKTSRKTFIGFISGILTK